MGVKKCDDIKMLIFELYYLQSWKPQSTWYFRGQGDSTWGLVPSLFRNEKIFDKKNFEDNMIMTLRKSLQQYSIIPVRLIDDEKYLLSLAQHYGAPTRMLDWTLSAMAAAYFAASSAIREKSSSFAVFCIEEMVLTGELSKKLTLINPPAGANENLFAQDGIFVKHEWDYPDMWKGNYEKEIKNVSDGQTDELESRIFRLELPTSFAKELLNELYLKGITGLKLFPGMSGIARTASDFAWIDV